jgi:hypothetical protein
MFQDFLQCMPAEFVLTASRSLADLSREHTAANLSPLLHVLAHSLASLRIETTWELSQMLPISQRNSSARHQIQPPQLSPAPPLWNAVNI